MLRAIFAAAGAALLSLVGIEAFLHAAHDRVLPVALSNQVATGYHGGWNGIYRWDATTNMYRMRPDFVRSMFFNGYTWEHRTDGNGLRHPRPIESAPVLLLGDSMIYGHGVEQEDTVRERLERELGVPVANLGMQGASAHEEFQLLRSPGLSLDPKVAVVFFLYNDPTDLLDRLSQEEMNELVFSPPRDLDAPYFTQRRRVGPDAFREWISGFYSVRALDAVSELANRAWKESGNAHAARRPFWGKEANLALGAHNELVRRMNRLARENDVVLLHVFIDTGQRPRLESRFERILRTLSDAEGIPFLSLGPAFDAARAAGHEPFLPKDGHFSAKGAHVVAETIADWIAQENVDVGRPLSSADAAPRSRARPGSQAAPEAR